MIVTLDAGHGGLNAIGDYLTAGKRSPEIFDNHGNYIGIYEGDFNRAVAEQICMMEDSPHLVDFFGNTPVDLTLKQRADYINSIADKEQCINISIHANAARGNGWSKAHGVTVFYNPKIKESKQLGQKLSESMFNMTELDTRGIKDGSGLYMIRKVRCPSVLIECGFMTCKKDAEYLASIKGQDDIAEAISAVIEGI